MPTVKQEKMDVTSEDSRDDQNTKSNRVQLKEFQVLNTSVPPPTYSYGKTFLSFMDLISILRHSSNTFLALANFIAFYFLHRWF